MLGAMYAPTLRQPTSHCEAPPYTRPMLALALGLMLSATPAPSSSPTPEATRRPHVLRDAALAAGGSIAVAMIKPDIRRAIRNDGSLDNVVHNFTHPISAIRDGTRRDTDPFLINYVAHPAVFGAEALFLKHEGYSNKGAFLFTQVHSVAWEFVVEGCAFPPSGKDLLTDAAGAAVAIWLVHPLLRTHAADVRIAPIRGGVEMAVVF